MLCIGAGKRQGVPSALVATRRNDRGKRLQNIEF
jgi:hypothetical protein